VKLGAVAQESTNAYYRIVLPMMALQERGHEVVRVEQQVGTPIEIDPLVDCDLVHIHRPLLIYDDGATVARLLEAGVAVGFDEDDNIVDAPVGLEERTGQHWLPRARRNFELLLTRVGDVDVVTTPSPHLADRFEESGADNVHVIDNYLPGAFSRVAPLGHEGLVIGWHGADEHGLDAEALGISRTLLRVLAANPDVSVVTINVDLGIEHERYRREDPVPFAQLTQRLADFDIGIVPLADIPFNLGRSNVKAREYAAAGVPWLASPVGAYEGLGWQEGGQLVADDEWFEALDKLIRARRDRAKQAKRAKTWAKRETVWHTAEIWERAFRDAIEDARAVA
jgi:hypothetical protein